MTLTYGCHGKRPPSPKKRVILSPKSLLSSVLEALLGKMEHLVRGKTAFRVPKAPLALGKVKKLSPGPQDGQSLYPLLIMMFKLYKLRFDSW